MSMPYINFDDKEKDCDNDDSQNNNRQSLRTNINHSGIDMDASSDSMSIDSIDTDDNGVYESYYDSRPIGLSVIIEDLLKGDKYEQAQANYMLEKEQMISNKVSTKVGSGRDALTWSVRSDVRNEEINKQKPFNTKTGVYGCDFNDRTVCLDGRNQHIDMLQLFKLLWPGDIGTQLTKLNTMIHDSMTDYAFRKKQLVKPITQHEILKFCAILMIARYKGVASGNLWKNGGRSEGYRDIPNIANKYMQKYRFDEIKWYVAYLWSEYMW